jgi:rod shape-determining protein MreC
MESVLGRYRNLIILMGVLFLQVLGLAVQVKRSADVENTRLIRVWAVDLMTPLERGLVWTQNGAGTLWHNYFYLRGVRAENRQLKDQIEQMRLEQVRLSEDAAQAHRLQALLAFKERFVSKTVPAQVIGSAGSDSQRVIYIDKGEYDGLKRDLAVITAEGIVGKVLQVYPSVSQVLLINDQSSGVGALLEKTRLQGVLRGTANGEVVLDRVMSDEQVPVGETILTSGGDQIFPKGMPIGTVAKVGGEKELFLTIRVKPAANLSKLEEVLVVLQNREPQTTAADNARGRAADILAQRLPSVPDKAAMDMKAAGSTGGSAPSKVTNPTGSAAGTRPQAQLKSPGVAQGPPAGSTAVVRRAAPVATAPSGTKLSPGSIVEVKPPKSATLPDATNKAEPQKPQLAEPQTAEPRTVPPPAAQPKPGPPPTSPAAEDSPH